MRTLRKTAQWAMVGLAVLGIASRVLVPAGFMPASLEESWPVQLCPGHGAGHAGAGLPAPDRGQDESDEDVPIPCPIGRAFSSAALVDEVDLVVSLELVAELTPPAEAATSESTPPCPRPRGPPAPLSLDPWRPADTKPSGGPTQPADRSSCARS